MIWESIREARQKLERERGTIIKDWGGRLHVALVYPNSYYLGMSSLGFQTVYGALNAYDNIVCERVFCDPAKRRSDEPISIESQRPLPDFDVIAFSISYELDYFNAIRVLRAGGIPPHAADRDESHPLVAAGGPCITANPTPLSAFFDCFAIGEGEAIIPGFVAALAGTWESGKERLLEHLASVPGIYVPRLYNGNPVRRQWLADLDSADTASVILTPDTELSDMYLIEIARGCGWGCRFCLAGFVFRPFRARTVDSLLARAASGLERTRRIGLLAAAVSDHPQIEDLVIQLRGMGAQISVSSLRMNPLPEALLRALAESGTQTVSLAPEAGSERLRRFINKNVTEDDIVRAVDRAAELGLRQIKLYFMIGLPTESDEDVEDLVRLSLKLKGRIERTGSRVVLTVEPFVPKAGTPFQRLAMAGAETLQRRMDIIKSGLARSGVEARTESFGWCLIQGLLARGDDRLGAVLAALEKNSLAAWRRALRDRGLGIEEYVHRDMPVDEPLPWSVVDSGVCPDYLAGELANARRLVQSPPCPPNDCRRCGVCPG